jgi:murein DD-endopeptidase MepM/ murein hydrolase activator NlpD
MSKIDKKIIFFILLIIFLIPTSFTYANNYQNTKKLKEVLEKNKQKIAINKEKIAQKKQKAKLVLNELFSIEKEINVTSKKLKQTKKMLSWYKIQVRYKEKELSIIKKRYQHKKIVLTKRIVQIYKNKNLGFLEFLFSPKDFSSVMDYSYYFERILKRDLALIEEIKRMYGQISHQKQTLNVKKQQVTTVSQDISEQKQFLSVKQKQKKDYLHVLKKEIARYERENRILLQDSRRMALMIQNSYKSNRIFLGTGRFIQPTNGWISSPFGWRTHPIFRRRIFHTGLDIAADYGRQIRSADNGVVMFAGRWGGYGNVVIIDHGKSITTVYAHMSRFVVNKGNRVSKGNTIGYVGSTGFSTGPHLHFEVRINGNPVNPLSYVRY